jgi:hypothetical protein
MKRSEFKPKPNKNHVYLTNNHDSYKLTVVVISYPSKKLTDEVCRINSEIYHGYCTTINNRAKGDTLKDVLNALYEVPPNESSRV